MKAFANRHIGIRDEDLAHMLKAIGVGSLEELADKIVPEKIREETLSDFPEAMTERAYLKMLRSVARENQVFRSLIGQGYYGTITPSVIQRNVFENPGWYTQYTPYQAEISQGRLEALLIFQTMVSDLTALPIANASLLDEGTAAAEAMSMLHDAKNKRRKDDKRNKLFVDQAVFGQTYDVLQSRAEPVGIELVSGDWRTAVLDDDCFGVLIQYPDAEGSVNDYRQFVAGVKEKDIAVIVAADLLSLTLLTPPGEWGADVVVGNTQRFGIPMGFGGPHAAFFATHEEYKRQIPGRIIGVSVDRLGKPALRMALQTREQHIKREKATSNICTAQALLAVMAAFYSVYHGPDGLQAIADAIHKLARTLEAGVKKLGLEVKHANFFDTVLVECDEALAGKIRTLAQQNQMNFHFTEEGFQVAFDETCDKGDVKTILNILSEATGKTNGQMPEEGTEMPPHPDLVRTSEYMTHQYFHRYRSETDLMRFLKLLENRDLSLVHSMIPLGSCTMKLNAATELMPLSWHEFANVHPFAPEDQTKGYRKVITELEEFLSAITGFEACSLMPNSGAQGELTGLLTIRAYHIDRGESHRNVALIPSSAHGTNPASAVMAGMEVVVVQCDEHGNIDLEDLKAKAGQYSDTLSSLMVTYPSTHGVYEPAIKDVCDIVHQHGGLVYMDGANMNAQVGLTSPGEIHADVCHLNLHKTFAIPHGGGGPGMGPICANQTLAPYLPRHRYRTTGGEKGIPAVASAPYGSASILLISYAYIKLLGKEGLRQATVYAMLNANYLKSRLEEHYPILYTGPNGMVAHEFIVDLRDFKHSGVSAEDLAKRLIDYGFHAPTLSFPVAGTFMIEPTESESLLELDRFCDAMISMKEEVDEIARGEADPENNVIRNAPHTIEMLMDDQWNYPYSRQKAVYPLDFLREEHKFWCYVGRIDNAYGDRNLVCTCPPMEAYSGE